MHCPYVDIPIIRNYKDLVSVYFFFNYERIAETILVIAGRVVSEGNACCALWAEVLSSNTITFRAATK
jgi:hypothetical protein